MDSQIPLSGMSVGAQIKHLRRMHRDARTLAERQLLKIRAFTKDDKLTKHGRHFWAFTIIESFWDDVDFVISLGKRRERYHAVPYTRIALEKLTRFGYFRLQDLAIQEGITEKEILKIAMRLYKTEPNAGSAEAVYLKKLYDEVNVSGHPEIDKAKESDLSPFPQTVETMLLKSGIYTPDKWYDDYRFFSEAEHGGLFYQIFRQDKDGEYKRSLMTLISICWKMLEWTDISLKLNMKDEIQDLLKKSPRP